VHYTGVSWSLAASPVATDFHGVWGSSASDIFAVGNGGTIIHYDGSQWTRMSSPTTETLWSVWGTGANNVYAVGANETIVRYDGVSWKTIRTAPTASTYFTIWGSGPEDIYALGCGNPGITSRFDGARWRTVTNVCAWAMTGFPSGGAVAVLWGRFAWFGLSPNGQLGASHASAFGGGDAPLSRPVITYGSGTSTPNAPRQ
jgi:hypothetical protein